MDKIQSLLLITPMIIHMGAAQPTTINDATLCDDVINYSRVVRDLEIVTKELKSLRTSVKSVETSQSQLVKSLANRLLDSKTLRDAINSNGLVKLADFKSGLNEFVDQISSGFEGVKDRLESKLSLLESSVAHHKDKSSLDSEMLKFYLSQKFTALDSSGKSSFVQIDRHLQDMNSTILRKLETVSQNMKSTSAKSRNSIAKNLGFEITQARVAMVSAVTKTSQSLSRKVNRLTTTTVDSLMNIKDVLNHHHVTTRLAAGTSALNGRVEVFLNGVWGTVCDDGWDDVDAGVVCKKLGFCNGTAKSRGYYGPGTGPVFLDNVECHGNETDLFDCPHNGVGIENCDRFEDAAVQCSTC